MKNYEKEAERIADALFALGDEPDSPCNRLQFMGGAWPHNERSQGGVGRPGLVRFLTTLLAEPVRPAKPAPLKEDLTHVFVETVKERFAGVVTSSDVRQATQKDVDEAREKHIKGFCNHSVVKDTKGYLYDYRFCYICGKELGTV